ncbi:MAG TPA: hypothetical protein VG053_04455 [Solirubrobacteraceae bacterium]|jgi:hypothetical protein|nr:hypothetical protein [Solirubrobacteraceae bacterium]
MRAAALLQRLPHPADTERPRRHRRRKRTAAARTRSLHLAAPTAGQDASVARVRLAGGPIDNASYTCACGFVFAASVSTTVRCPHCGADQAW